MTALSEILPSETKIVEAIYAYHKKKGDSEPARGYLGASMIGHNCDRFLWLTFRSCVKANFDGRMYRLFETGDLAESRFIAELRAIGCEVYDRDENGSQFAVEALGGHFSGHMDGCVLGIPEATKAWHVCEFKTHNNKSFTKLKKEGVQKSKPQHYAQMQVYMGLSGMTRALYLAVNKDTDDLYSERVRYDKADLDNLMARAERIITSTQPPERISTRQDYYECSYCDAKEICWGSQDSALPVPAINCRQCCHATPTMDGHAAWKCEKHKRGLSLSDQSKVCDDHLTLPGLMDWTCPTNGNFDTIEFTNKDGKKWEHGKGGFSTKELMAISLDLLTNKTLVKAKEVMGAVVTSCCDNILERYPEGDCEIIWNGESKYLWDDFYKIYDEDMASCLLKTVDDPEFHAAEFTRGRIAIVWKQKQFGKIMAEIRKGKG